VGIDTAESSKIAPRALGREHHISYPIVGDPQGRTATELGGVPTHALPVTVLIDKRQRVAAVYIGTTNLSTIEHALESLAGE
jgi:hypothetical protein